MKVITLTQMVIGILTAVLLSINAYAENKKIIATSQERKRLGLMPIQSEIGGIPVSIGHLNNYLRVFKSTNSDWDNTTSYSFYVTHGSGESLKGYIVDVHSNGDQTVREFEGTWKFEDNKGEGKTEGWFISGTGKFKGISGKWEMTTTRTSTGTVSEFRAEYKIR